MDNRYVLIMAGGSGTRLWPLSRKGKPKPALPLVEEERTMFQISVQRLSPLFPPERIFVIANAELSALLHSQTPEIPVENFIIEPEGRDTAPAVGLGAIHIRHRNPDAIMAVLTADHYIKDVDLFCHTLETACQMAADGAVVTLGITPDHPATGFGYIERGEESPSPNQASAYILKRFTEKPDKATAEAFIASGNYSWNSGMFIWPVKRVLSEFETHAPTLYAQLDIISKAIGSEDYQSRLAEVWKDVKKISVDYALMEHIQGDACVIPVQMGWADIGNFSALYDILSNEEGENVILGHPPLTHQTSGSLIYSNRLVATVGIDDLVIVDTDDVLLICRREDAQDVKKLVEILKEEKRNNYL